MGVRKCGQLWGTENVPKGDFIFSFLENGLLGLIFESSQNLDVFEFRQNR